MRASRRLRKEIKKKKPQPQMRGICLSDLPVGENAIDHPELWHPVSFAKNGPSFTKEQIDQMMRQAMQRELARVHQDIIDMIGKSYGG
jgi:hypothetical protein